MHIKERMNLLLFDGTDAAGDGSGTGSVTGNEAAEAQNPDEKIPWHMLRNKPQMQEDDTEGDSAAAEDNTEEGSVTPWEEVKKKYESDYKKDVDAQIKRRFKSQSKESTELKEQNAKFKELADVIANKYPGIDTGNIDALLSAVKGDDMYFRQRALDKGISVEDEMSAYERNRELENARRQLQEYENERAAQRTAEELTRQANELKGTYPDFELSAALQNDTFVQMLNFTRTSEGVENVRKAYEFAFADQIREQTIHRTVDKTRLAISQSNRARQNMPSPPGHSKAAHRAGEADILKTMSAKELAEKVLYGGENIAKYFK